MRQKVQSLFHSPPWRVAGYESRSMSWIAQNKSF